MLEQLEAWRENPPLYSVLAGTLIQRRPGKKRGAQLSHCRTFADNAMQQGLPDGVDWRSRIGRSHEIYLFPFVLENEP